MATDNAVQKMNRPNEIVEVFGIFHDGVITGGSVAKSTAEIVVKIKYLGERIRPDYRRFTIRLSGFASVRFAPWADQGAPSIAEMTNLSEIAQLDLGILSAETEGEAVKVACTQDRPGLGYSGGFLNIAAGGYQVFDEGGSEWVLTDLQKLSEDYWREWKTQH